MPDRRSDRMPSKMLDTVDISTCICICIHRYPCPCPYLYPYTCTYPYTYTICIIYLCIYIYMSWTMDLIYVMYQRISRIAKCQAARPVWLQCAMDDFTAVPWRCGRRALKVLNLGIFQQGLISGVRSNVIQRC